MRGEFLGEAIAQRVCLGRELFVTKGKSFEFRPVKFTLSLPQDLHENLPYWLSNATLSSTLFSRYWPPVLVVQAQWDFSAVIAVIAQLSAAHTYTRVFLHVVCSFFIPLMRSFNSSTKTEFQMIIFCYPVFLLSDTSAGPIWPYRGFNSWLNGPSVGSHPTTSMVIE